MDRLETLIYFFCVCMEYRAIMITGAEAYSQAQFGQGSGPIVLDDLDCNGDEVSILNCDFDQDTSDCTHFEDAGIRCVESPS